MLNTAISNISSSNGTTPAKVHTAFATHFHRSTSNAFATSINIEPAGPDVCGCLPTTIMSPLTGGSVESTWACRGANLRRLSGACLESTFGYVPFILVNPLLGDP